MKQLFRLVRAIRVNLPLVSFFCFVGTSSSALAAQFPTTHHVLDLAVGDVNNDGFADVITCGSDDHDIGSVDALLGNGEGMFPVHRQTPVPNGPGAIALGDFNRDGHLDVATANFGYNAGLISTVSVLLGFGFGEFLRHQDVAVGGKPNSIGATDLNSDGIPELVVGENSKVAILSSERNARFKLSSALNVPKFSNAIAVGDLNGDGSQDVLVTNNVQTQVSIFLGNGDESFQPRIRNTVGAPLKQPRLVDLDGDGVLDLVGIDASFPNGMFFYLGNGDGTLTRFKTSISFGAEIRGFTSGDFNGDGNSDLALTVGEPPNYTLWILSGRGDGSFDANVLSVPIGDVIAVGDFNSDSVLDLVSGGGPSSFTVITAYGRGDGTFVDRPPSP